MWIELPEEANTKVFCIPKANQKLDFYIFWQKEDNLSVIACDSYQVDRDAFDVNPLAKISDLIKDVLL